VASIERRTDRPDGGWLVRWRDAGGRQRKRSFRTERDAKRLVRQIEAEQDRARLLGATTELSLLEPQLGPIRQTGFDPRGYFVYCLWGADPNRPLYVGMSENVLARIGDHTRNPDRRHAIERVTLLHCPGRHAARETEARLIAESRPLWNVAGIPHDAAATA
jgi:predicted GIY-YIG superfamily endonuclease